MPNMNRFFVTEESKPILVGGQKISFISRALRLAVPQGGFGGVIWNRPVAVRVQTEGGAEHILPVVDETRRRKIAIFIAGLVLVLFVSLVAGRRFN
jgi:hypothetical protein